MTTLNFPHRDDNHWLTIEVGGVEHPQYPSPLEVKMLIEEAVRKERERIIAIVQTSPQAFMVPDTERRFIKAITPPQPPRLV